MDVSKDLTAEITNDFISEPTGAQQVTPSELKNSYQSQYAGYGGSAEAASQLAAGGNSVATGDTTNIALYLSLLAAAVCLMAAVIFIRKKKKQ